MISEIAQAMVNHMTAEHLARVMRLHPTFEEAMSGALNDLIEKLNL